MHDSNDHGHHTPAKQPALSGDGRQTKRSIVGGPLRSNLGKVVDLSSTGALVVSRTAGPEGTIAFIVGDTHGSVSCAARVVWTRRCGLFRHEIGLSFPELAPEQAATIRRLVAEHELRNDYGMSERREAA